jgi:hypothetical protein
MTLIATYKERNIPLLIGDVLTTRIKEEFHCKKINKISSNFVVGWTGYKDNAMLIFKNLYEEFENKIVSKSEIERFLVNFDVSQFVGSKGENKLILSGWIVDYDGEHPFVWNSGYNEYGIKEIVSDKEASYFNGSGANFFQSLLSEKPVIREDMSKSDSEDAKSLILHEMLYLTVGEYLSVDKSWRNAFGFGYEALIFDGKKFNYISDILYVVVDVFFNENIQLLNYFVAQRVTKYKSYNHFCVFEVTKGKDFPLEQYFIGRGDKKIDSDVEFLRTLHKGNFFLPSSKYLCIGTRYFINNKFVDSGDLILPMINSFVTINSHNGVNVFNFSPVFNKSLVARFNKLLEIRNKK